MQGAGGAKHQCAAGDAPPAAHCSSVITTSVSLRQQLRHTHVVVVAMTPLILQIVHFKIIKIT